jgi:hypothetical protein
VTRKKKAAFLLVTCLAGLIAFELAWRIVFAFKVGPSVLLYGTHLERRQIDTAKPGGRTAILHENALGNYSKYFPNQARSDYDSATDADPIGALATQFRAPRIARALDLGRVDRQVLPG